MSERDRLEYRATTDVITELQRATRLHPAGMRSGHEGHGINREEFEELWEAVKMHRGPERTAAMRKEAVQLAAMAIRFIVEVCDSEVASVNA